LSDPDARRRESLEQWDGAAAGWANAQSWMRDAMAPVSRWLIGALELEPGQTVLELAAGPGETGFIAARRVAPSGGLISSDYSEAMLAVARARAAELGLENVEFRVINAESIDLPVACVDAVVCRWGYMLIVDPLAALVETRRVLKPGGRVALAVWAAASDNLWLSLPRAVAVERGLIEPSDSGPFALSEPALLRSLLEEAGFSEVTLDTVELELGDDWWERYLGISPMGAKLADAETEVKRRLGAQRVTARSLVAVASA
jgi:ubiquinone/menaquinone biosynthesis C-methylase UbiE